MESRVLSKKEVEAVFTEMIGLQDQAKELNGQVTDLVASLAEISGWNKKAIRDMLKKFRMDAESRDALEGDEQAIADVLFGGGGNG